MKSKVSRVLLALLMIVTLITQLIPIQAITAYAESTSTSQVQESNDKTKATESTNKESVGTTSESTTDSSKNQESIDAAEPSENIEESETVDSDTEEADAAAKEDIDLDGSIYGSGAGVPGDQVLLRASRALSPDLPTFFGIDTQAITKELTAHQNDGFYLGTGYRGLYTNPDENYCMSPNGAPNSYGPGMNCTGFIATVIKRAGGDISRITNNSTGFGGAANAYNWRDVLRATTKTDTFDSITEMLASGTMKKGDIIYFEPDKTVTNYDCHIGFFWGNSPNENKFWHSYDPGGNIISEIKAKTPSEKIYVFHNADEPEIGKVLLKKTDDTGKALQGVEFKLTANGKSTTSKTNANGELSTPDYVVGTKVDYEETATVAGHYIDTATSKGTVTIKEGTNTITVKNPRYANLTLNKKNDAGLNLEGVTIKLTWDGKEQKVKTDSKGQLKVTNQLKDNTKVEYEEIETIAGHYIDTKTSKGSIVVKSGENTINITNPRYANLTILKLDDNGVPLDGVTFKITANGKTEEIKTKDGGKIILKNQLKHDTKVDWEETKTIKGHFIDPENYKGSIVVKSGENTLNVNNPTLNFGMSSQAANTDGEQFINPAKDQELREEVMIEAHQAPANAKLRLTTDFVEFGTGEQLTEESLKQVTEFEATQARFVKTVNLNFDATGLNGKKGVFTNVLEYFNPSTDEWEEVARHDDLKNELESIQIVSPNIHTEFFFYDQNGNESKLSDPLAKVKGFDRTYYENLISGKTYVFDLALMDRESEKPFTDPNGKEVTGTLTVVAGKDGVVTSKVDAKEYYENLAKEEAEKEDSEKEGDDTKEEAKKAADIKPLSTEEGQEEATDGEEEVQTEYSEMKAVELLTGYVDVPFEADLSVANGKVVVAYEQLSTNETPIADHKDPDSEEQSGKIRNPEISTKALVNGAKEATEDGKLVLEDTVSYSDLTPGVEYEQKVIWMVKNTGEALELKQKEITGTIKFTPEKENGEVTVKVIIDGKELFEKYGETVDLVAFEETVYDSEKIAEHKDIDDKGQTVTIKKPAVPVSPGKTYTVLPQTAAALTNPIVLIAVALALVAGAIFVFKNRKDQAK